MAYNQTGVYTPAKPSQTEPSGGGRSAGVGRLNTTFVKIKMSSYNLFQDENGGEKWKF
jgi:hypothetical protein